VFNSLITLDGIAQFVKIIDEPQDQIIKLKKRDLTVRLCCNAESPSRHDLSYEWYDLKAYEKPGSFNEQIKSVKGSKSCLELSMKSSSHIHERRYCCKVSAAGHSIWSRIVLIKFEHGKFVMDWPDLCCACNFLWFFVVWIVEQPKERTVVFAGRMLELSCKAESAPGEDVRYKWFTCNKNGANKQPVKFDCMKLIIPKANVSHRGYYVCEISDKVDSRVIYIEVVNSADIKITMPLPRNKYIMLGEELILECKAKCENYPVEYKWYFNDHPLHNATEQQLVIPIVTQSDIGSYYCTISSAYSAGVVKSDPSRLVLSEWLICQF